MQPAAYSYIRFSHPSQAEGDGLRRQTERAAAYCTRRGWTLDTSLTLRDLGVSAFRGDNAAVGNFRTFLDAVKTGKVAPGSVLIVESIDRISRQGIDEGYDLIKGILKAGVRIVTLSPEREFDVAATKGLTKGALEIQLILERAAEESERKSDRIGASWAERKRRGRENGEIITRQLPAWIKELDGKLFLIHERAKAVRRIFELAKAGYGLTSIVKKLTADGVPPIARSPKWVRSYVGFILRDRRALGEFQPRKLDGSKDGEPILNYFPSVITKDEWDAARAAVIHRGKHPGRTGRHINVFSGLLKNAREGDAYFLFYRTRRYGPPILVNRNATEGLSRRYSFPFAIFQLAVLKCLQEIRPEDVEGRNDADNGISKLETEQAHVEGKLAELGEELLTGDSPTITKAIRKLEARRKELIDEIAEAKRKSLPAGESWRECRSLLDLLDNSPDPMDTKLRLRAVLRRNIDSIWMLADGRGRDRLAMVQVWFAGEKVFRNYYILYRPPRDNGVARKRGMFWVKSIPYVHDPKQFLDLRDPDAAKWALLRLLTWEPERDRDRFVLKGTIE